MQKFDKTVLIFEPQISGHHLEYIHHIYTGATKCPETIFIIAVPERFTSVKDKFSWIESENIQIELLNNETLNNKLNIIRQLIRLYNKFKPQEVFFITLMWLMPFLALFIFTPVKLSGIIYNIYLYGWKNSSIFSKAKNALLYSLFTYCRCFKHIFILNDNSAVAVLNKVWHTNKYIYLPDPFVPIDCDQVRNLRSELNINDKKIVYLHFGAMSERKGTLDIFNMVENTPSEQLSNYCLIFAGKIGNDIKQQFYAYYEKWKNKIQIIIEDDFVDYERIGSYLITCDAVLLPYKYVNLSSGVIGYCAQFNKPAIATNKGLIGKLIRKNQLGLGINNYSSLSLKFSIINGSRYCQKRSEELFTSTIVIADNNYASHK